MILEKLKEEKERTEREMMENQRLMEDKIKGLLSERQKAERAILGATITIQRFARGWITRMKIRKVQEMQVMYEKARLDEQLNDLQSMI